MGALYDPPAMDAELELRPASSFEADELAALFTRGYEGYSIPLQVDAAALSSMMRTFDVDLDASRVAVRGDEPVGLANLGIRDRRGWVGGVGVVVEARRRGVGRVLMEALHDEARARGLEVVRLEVIEDNHAAIRLYEQLGYELVRELAVATLADEAADGEGEEVAADEALGVIRTRRREREPWQREDETLAHYDDLRGLVAGDTAAVYRLSSGRVTVLQHAVEERDAERLLRALRVHGPVALFNVPADDPALAALVLLGGSVAVRQRELTLRL